MTNYWKPSLWKKYSIYRYRQLSQQNIHEQTPTYAGHWTHDKNNIVMQLGKKIFSTNDAGSMNYHMDKKESWLLPHTLHKK